MMTDTAVQQQTDPNGQTLVTESEREALVQRLTTKWTIDLSKRVEGLAYEKSRGVKAVYYKFVQNYYQQVQNAYQNRAQQQQQQLQQQQQQQLQQQQLQQQSQQQQTLQSLNNNPQYLNQQLNLPQQASVPMLNQSQHPLNTILNQQIRFSSPQQSLQPRMTNPQTGVINTQSGVLNQVVRLREPQKSNQSSLNTIQFTSPSSSSSSPLNSAAASSTVQKIDLSQSYTAQQQINNINLSDYLSQSPLVQSRYPTQQTINSRLRTATNSNGNLPQISTSNNSNDILHQFVVGNPSANSMASSSSSSSSISSLSMVTPVTNTSSTGDRLLQQILSSNTDGPSNKMPIQNRQPSLSQSTSTIIPQPIRSVNTTNSNMTNSVNSLRSSLISQQPSPSPSVTIMSTTPQAQISNVQIQPSSNVTVQQSPLNNSNGPFSANTQIIPQPPSITMNNSTPSFNNYSSPMSRSLPLTGSGSISSPDEEIINLIKYLKDNIGRIQALCQKFTNEGHPDKARNAQVIHQQMVQFINNPTYESLANAKHIRDNLERATSRSQQSNSSVPNATIPNNSIPTQTSDLNQIEKGLNEFISRDQRKRLYLSKLFIEPLNDVINGVPHKKIRLDNDNSSNRPRITTEYFSSLNQSSLLSNLNDELALLPANMFFIEYLPISPSINNNELNDEYLNKTGIIVRCKLLELSNPLIPSLRLRISTRYPQEQPEILSLTKSMAPKLEFTDGHPFLEQISTLFVSYLFKLPPQYTVTDILNIWRQSVQAAM
ncbi:unnamed protein product [Rotaria sp. Silwood2]